MKTPTAIILAAGLGKRMKSNTAKVLHPIAGQSMVVYTVERALGLNIRKIVVVVGYQAERIKEVVAPFGVEVVHQSRQQGTADAVMQTEEILGSVSGPILILNADTPLITESTLRLLMNSHKQERATLTLLTAAVSRPEGYGRVVRAGSGKIQRVVEHKEAGPRLQAIKEINTGFYVVEKGFLFKALKQVKNLNRQGEYYLTDIIEIALKQRLKVAALKLNEGVEEILGINTRLDLATAEKIMQRRILLGHLRNGVTLMDPNTAWIDAGVLIGQDTSIYPHVQIQGRSQIGENCVIRSHTRIADCRIGSGVEIRDSCVMTGSTLEEGVIVGPFAHLRSGTVLRRGAKIGNFVEAKKADLGEGSKANHLTYLGV